MADEFVVLVAVLELHAADVCERLDVVPSHSELIAFSSIFAMIGLVR